MNKELNMNLLEFTRESPDEASCRKKFKEYRENMGVVCPKCGSKDHYWKSDKRNLFARLLIAAVFYKNHFRYYSR